MKKTKRTVVKIAKLAAEQALKRDARQTSCVAFYQPKVPAQLARYKKENP
ncbi:MAG: cyclic lactone autoinducer peptide [Oscillospiraceae bacterium]|nr:cyclic lactone autoinducer peptide [Oscillospiraceae bacterium]